MNLKKAVFGVLVFCLALPFAGAQIRRIGSSSQPSPIQRMNFQDSKSAAPAAKENTIPKADPMLTADGNKTVELPKQPMREWVVMIYMNGKNNLEAGMVEDINELERVGSDDKIAFVVELGRMPKFAKQSEKEYGLGYWTGNRRYLIAKNPDLKENSPSYVPAPVEITSPVIFKKSQDMGDVNNVISFAKWTKQRFPAKNYMFILSNHGQGFLDPDKNKKPADNPFADKGISFDDKSGNYIRTTQLTKMLKDMGGADVFVADACLMQMMEVLYQLKGLTKYVVASEEVAYGYDFSTIAKSLTKEVSSLTAEKAATIVVQEVDKTYKARRKAAPSSYHTLTISAVDMTKFPGIITALNSWTKTIMEASQPQMKKALLDSVKDAYRFEFLWSADLGVFVKQMSAFSKDAKVKAEGDKVLAAIDRAVVAKASTGVIKDLSEDKYYRSVKGISTAIVLRTKEQGSNLFDGEKDYFTYPYVKQTGWGKFYKWMLNSINEVGIDPEMNTPYW